MLDELKGAILNHWACGDCIWFSWCTLISLILFKEEISNKKESKNVIVLIEKVFGSQKVKTCKSGEVAIWRESHNAAAIKDASARDPRLRRPPRPSCQISDSEKMWRCRRGEPGLVWSDCTSLPLLFPLYRPSVWWEIKKEALKYLRAQNLGHLCSIFQQTTLTVELGEICTHHVWEQQRTCTGPGDLSHLPWPTGTESIQKKLPFLLIQGSKEHYQVSMVSSRDILAPTVCSPDASASLRDWVSTFHQPHPETQEDRNASANDWEQRPIPLDLKLLPRSGMHFFGLFC